MAKEISTALFKKTVIDAILKWAKDQQATDKFGEITLSRNDLSEVAHYILRAVRKIAK